MTTELIFPISCLFMCVCGLAIVVLLTVHLSRITYPERVEAKEKEHELEEKIERDTDPIPKIRALTDEYEADNEQLWRRNE